MSKEKKKETEASSASILERIRIADSSNLCDSLAFVHCMDKLGNYPKQSIENVDFTRRSHSLSPIYHQTL